MATTTTNSATLTMEYTDASTRNITFSNVATSALGNIKERVLDLNDKISDSVTGAAYKDTFTSDDGAPIRRISKAKYTTTTEEVIYSG